MTPKEKRVIAGLLWLAEREFANHMCNDFDMAKYGASETEAADIVLKRMLANDPDGGEKEFREIRGNYCTELADWILMAHFARRLEAEADAEDGKNPQES